MMENLCFKAPESTFTYDKNNYKYVYILKLLIYFFQVR